jgi:Fe-S-cluster-containing dehydrogenase component
LAAEGTESNLAQEPVVAAEGDYPNGIILIRSGVARLSRRHHHGHRTMSYLSPGAAFGAEEIWEAFETGRSVVLKNSLRAIGYLSTIVIPTPLVEAHLLGRGRATVARPSSKRLERNAEPVIESKKLSFLVEGGFVNGTATMLINLDRCTRCDDCVRACASTHDNNPRFLRQGPIHDNLMVAHACMHCQDPVCMIECPTGAISRQLDEGAVTINDQTCIGCGTCSKNCPYDAIRMVEVRDDRGMFIRATKDQKPIVKATKCDLCVDYWGGPACQRACPHDALVRIDMGNVDSVAAWLQR